MIIIIRKERILALFLVITTSFIVFNISFKDAKPVMYLPVTNKVIVIDPGHGGHDPGAIGKSGIKEKDINLDIALKVQGLLEQSGCITQLTRAVDESIHDKESSNRKKRSDLKNRKSIIDTSQADAFISIHLNSFPESKYKGVQTFYPESSEESKRLALGVQNELKTVLNIVDNRTALVIKDIYLIKNTKIPSVIVECGFLSNPQEEKNLATEKYREKIAWGIYLGVMKFFEGK